jgi:hypothetical protein
MLRNIVEVIKQLEEEVQPWETTFRNELAEIRVRSSYTPREAMNLQWGRLVATVGRHVTARTVMVSRQHARILSILFNKDIDYVIQDAIAENERAFG